MLNRGMSVLLFCIFRNTAKVARRTNPLLWRHEYLSAISRNPATSVEKLAQNAKSTPIFPGLHVNFGVTERC